MLVLALQFSKGIAGAGTVQRTFTWHAVAVEPKLVPGERVLEHPQWVTGSLKTEEKTKSVAATTTGGEPTTIDIETTDPPVHQLGTGSKRIGRVPIIA